MKIYVAVPLFSKEKWQFNKQSDAIVRTDDHKTFQRSGSTFVSRQTELHVRDLFDF